MYTIIMSFLVILILYSRWFRSIFLQTAKTLKVDMHVENGTFGHLLHYLDNYCIHHICS